MSLLTLTGALAVVSIAAIWASVKLVRYDIANEEGVNTAVTVRVWAYFVGAVLLIELGPPLANTVVEVVKLLL